MSDFMDRHFQQLRHGRKEYTEAEVRLIIEGAILEEREECAKVCEIEGLLWGQRYAAAIRARKQT